MARHIGRHIEKEMFARWKAGTASLMQLRQFTDALIAMLDERNLLLSEKVSKMPTELQAVQQRIAELSAQFNKVGFLGKHLTDKRGGLFADIGTQIQDQYILNTTHQGLKFDCSLLPFIKEQLTALRGAIDELHQNLAAADRECQPGACRPPRSLRRRLPEAHLRPERHWQHHEGPDRR